MHGVDAGTEDLGDVSAVGQDQCHDSPDEHLVGGSLQLQCGYAEAEQQDDEQRGYAAEDIDVDGREDAQRQEDRALQTPHEGDSETDDEDERLSDEEDPHVEPEGFEQTGE